MNELKKASLPPIKGKMFLKPAPSIWPRLLQTVLHVLFPTNCTICEKPLRTALVPFFCQFCWDSQAPLSGPCCPRCGQPFASPVALAHSPTHTCKTCRQRPPAFNQAWSIFPYQPPLKEAIGLFKYRGKLALAGPLSHLLLQHLPPLPPIDLIMPVPLHPKRLQEREFNQSAVLAHRLSRQLRLPLVLGTLTRHRQTAPQTSLKKKERLANVRGAFVVPHPVTIHEKRILLIDDVMTTGATLHECAKTLRQAGSGPVYGLTLARML